MTVHVINDGTRVGDTLSEVLSLSRYDVVLSTLNHDSDSELSKSNADVIICCVGINKFNTIRFIKVLRTQINYSGTPVFIILSHPDQESAVIFATLGVTRVFWAPVKTSDLIEAIKKVNYQSVTSREIALFPHDNPHPVLRISEQGDITYYNQSALLMLESLKQEEMSKIIDELSRVSRKSIESDSASEITLTVGKKSYHCSVKPLQSKRFANVYFVDITRQIQAEVKLGKTKELYEKILDNFPADIAVISPTWKYVYLNPKAIKNPELRKWMIGKSDADYCRLKQVPMQLAEQRKQLFNNAIQNNATTSWEDQYVNKDGSTTYLYRQLHPVFEKSKLKFVLGYATDITELKVSENKLKRSESNYRLLFEKSPVMQVITSADLIIHDVNHNVLDTLGIPKTNLIGQNLRNVIYKAQYQPVIEDQGTEESSDILEVALLNAQGKVFYCILDFNIIVDIDGTVNYLFSFVNITDTVETNKKLQEVNRDLKLQNENLRKFSMIISHDIKAPLANLEGLIDLYDDSLADDSNAEIVNGLRVSISKLRRNFDDLLEIINLRNQKNLKTELCRLHDALQSAISLLKTQIDGANCKIQIDFTDAPYVVFPRSWLETILMNLLSNSIKYRADNRKLEISLLSKNENSHITLIVSDNGKGIDLKKNRDFIFGLYQRFHPGIEGKGIGLHIVKTQMETYGGSISIASSPDKGTSIILKFNNPAYEI